MSDHLEFKAAFELGDKGEITGTAWPFGTPDRVGDIIEKGAFASAKFPLPMLFAHDPSLPVGVWESASEDASGLIVKGRLLIGHVAKADEAYALLKAGAMSGLSIGFSGAKAAPRPGRGRTITSLNLLEISLVTIPSHPRARLSSVKTFSQTATESAMRLAAAIDRARMALR